MDTKLNRLNQIFKRSSRIADLEDNPDFLNWREEVVESRLLAYLDDVLGSNLDTQDGRDRALNNLRNFQQLKFVAEDVFKLYKFSRDSALKEIRNRKEQNEQ